MATDTAEIEFDTKFPPGAHIPLHAVNDDEHATHVPGPRVGAVTADVYGTLRLTGLEEGTYWAVPGGLPPVLVNAKGSGRKPDEAAAAQRDAESGDSTPTPREIVGGARESQPKPGPHKSTMPPREKKAAKKGNAETPDDGPTGPDATAEPAKQSRQIVTGARTTATARPEPSVVERAKRAVKRSK